MLLEEKIYLGRENIITIALKSSLDTINHVANDIQDTIINQHSHPVATRCKLLVKPIVDDPSDTLFIIDSNVQTAAFDLVTNPLAIMVKLGEISLKPGRHVVSIVVYETGSSTGVDWGEILFDVVKNSEDTQI